MKRLVFCVMLAVAGSIHSGAAQDGPPGSRHIVVKVDGGEVSFKRPDWRQFAPVRFGTVLQTGDLVNVASNASAMIVCDGFATAVTVTGSSIKPVPCGGAAASKPTWWDGVPTFPTTRIDLPTIDGTAPPQFAMGKTYEPKPLLEWLRVEGATAYKVDIIGQEVSWSGTTKTNSVRPEVALPPVDADEPYEVSVTPMFVGTFDPKVDLQRPMFMKKFTVASRISNAILDTAVAEVNRLGLAPPVTSFLKAKLFAQYGSFDQAITSLEGIRGSLSEPARSKVLGDVYAAKGSLPDAEQSLSAAAALFEKDGDVVARAATDEAIASIQLKTPAKRRSAIARLQAAIKTYRELGDTTDAARVQLVLAALSLPSAAAK